MLVAVLLVEVLLELEPLDAAPSEDELLDEEDESALAGSLAVVEPLRLSVR